MHFEDLLTIVEDEPLFESSMLLAGDIDPASVQRQLSRWRAAGRILQLRRGLYSLAPPYRKVKPEPFLVANRLVSPSYVSLQSALAHWGMIPESVPVVTSVTSARGGRRETELGVFTYRHVQTGWLQGYRRQQLSMGQSALLALREKALLDLVYLTPRADDPEYLRELRLQGLDHLDLGFLRRLAESSGHPKLLNAVAIIAQLARHEETYEPL